MEELGGERNEGGGGGRKKSERKHIEKNQQIKGTHGDEGEALTAVTNTFSPHESEEFSWHRLPVHLNMISHHRQSELRAPVGHCLCPTTILQQDNTAVDHLTKKHTAKERMKTDIIEQ